MREDVSEALTIPVAGSPALKSGEARRLTGPGLLLCRPGATLEAEFAGFPPARVEALWLHHARRVLDGIGWDAEEAVARVFDGGMAVAISAPVDRLYSATFVVQTAWHFVAADLLWQPRGDLAAMLADLRDVMAREADPALVALVAEAQARGVELLADDEIVSLGHGVRSVSFPADALPAPGAVDWAGIGNLPLGLVTGTNGKTTTTRLAMAMAEAAGKVAGLTSTDMVRVGNKILERGDFSGPGGGRLLLRDPELEVGFLELARGGILRRGLPVRQARAAVVTNVADDHLGEYGINTVAELAQVKFAIRHGLGAGGMMILNADDPPVVAEAARLGLKAAWFSLCEGAPQLQEARTEGRLTGFLRDGAIWLQDGDAQRIVAVDDIPITMGGAARYNILNALGAALLAHALGVDVDAIAVALTEFRPDPRDNPGRMNLFIHNGARLYVDFAHNPHSIAAVTGALAAMPAKRKFVMMAHAGDRSDDDIRGLARGACAFHPDVVVVSELPGYLRGRETGEVPALLKAECRAQGVAEPDIHDAGSPSEGVGKIMGMVGPGDLALLLVHSERDRIFAMLGAAPQA
ncbi:MAG TPA: Mur ligase family protein [Tabrizicola sp.]|nr:Mur ligase family protein [Tabrizicola sp.]